MIIYSIIKIPTQLGHKRRRKKANKIYTKELIEITYIYVLYSARPSVSKTELIQTCFIRICSSCSRTEREKFAEFCVRFNHCLSG